MPDEAEEATESSGQTTASDLTPSSLLSLQTFEMSESYSVNSTIKSPMATSRAEELTQKLGDICVFDGLSSLVCSMSVLQSVAITLRGSSLIIIKQVRLSAYKSKSRVQT